jgi:hypothetical protein
MAKKKTPNETQGSFVPSFFPRGSSEEHNRLYHELAGQTDRGAAILGGSYLEWRVTQSIRTRIQIWGKEAESIFGSENGSGGELSYFYQARLAYCLGLIGEMGLKDAEKIGNIRNRFAHRLSVDSFSGDNVVRDWCRDLKSPEAFNESQKAIGSAGVPAPTDPRRRFEVTVELVSLILWSQAVSGKVVWPTPEPGLLFW